MRCQVHYKLCPTCDGKKEVKVRIGQGKTARVRCPDCDGTGKVVAKVVRVEEAEDERQE